MRYQILALLLGLVVSAAACSEGEGNKTPSPADAVYAGVVAETAFVLAPLGSDDTVELPDSVDILGPDYQSAYRVLLRSEVSGKALEYAFGDFDKDAWERLGATPPALGPDDQVLELDPVEFWLLDQVGRDTSEVSWLLEQVRKVGDEAALIYTGSGTRVNAL